ncbi:(2Fe-2S) ferredoxin domain-containing protein, partial [candidate division TA06 bacterium]|nr:(2Fe-2S) ferredoxin domain-containing protein [candidate division TA06 bacterium]
MRKVYRKHIFVCATEGEGKCQEKGGLELLRKFRAEVRERGLQDEVLVTKVGCTDQHPVGPTVIVHPDGIWYKLVQLSDIAEILEQHILGGKPVERL